MNALLDLLLADAPPLKQQQYERLLRLVERYLAIDETYSRICSAYMDALGIREPAVVLDAPGCARCNVPMNYGHEHWEDDDGVTVKSRRWWQCPQCGQEVDVEQAR